MSDKTLKKLEKLRLQLEKETGKELQIVIQDSQLTPTNILGSFEKSMKIKIDMHTDFKELDGIYVSFEDIKNKIALIIAEEKYIDIRHNTFGLCKFCNTKTTNINEKCKNEKCWESKYVTTKWLNVTLDKRNGKIYITNIISNIPEIYGKFMYCK